MQPCYESEFIYLPQGDVLLNKVPFSGFLLRDRVSFCMVSSKTGSTSFMTDFVTKLKDICISGV